MSPFLLTILNIVQFGLCLTITLLSLRRFSIKDIRIRTIGIMFLVISFGILQLVLPHSFYSTIHSTPKKIESLPFDFIFISILYAVVFGVHYYKLFAAYLFVIVSLSLLSVFSDLYIFRDSFLEIVSSALLSLYSLLYFYRLLNETPKQPLENNPMFWISTGILIYHIGFIIIAIMSSAFDKNSQVSAVMDLLHHALRITGYSIILIGLLVTQKRKK